jgi:hypothetical protein
MIAVAQSFQGVLRRDDLALERAAEQLAIALRDAIREFGIDGGKEDFNRLSSGELAPFVCTASPFR